MNEGKVEVNQFSFQVVNLFYLACTVTNITENKRYFFMSLSFLSSHLIRVAFFRNIQARWCKVTLKITTPKEVNIPIRSKKKKFSLSIGKWILFLKYLEFKSFLKFYIWACCYVLHWSLVSVIYTICFAQFLHIILYKFYLYFK